MNYISSANDIIYTYERPFSYYIEADGMPVYFGRTQNPNGAINITRRIRDYLDTSMPDFRNYNGVVVPHTNQLRVFNLRDANGNILESYTALLEYTGTWSIGLEDSQNGNWGPITDPINGHADIRQKIFWGTVESIPTEYDLDSDGEKEHYFNPVSAVVETYREGGVFTVFFDTNYKYVRKQRYSSAQWVTLENVSFSNTGQTLSIASKNDYQFDGDRRTTVISLYAGDEQEDLYGSPVGYITVIQYALAAPVDYPPSPSGVPQPNEIWINKEAYLASGTSWFEGRGENTGMTRFYDIYGKSYGIGVDYTVTETDTHKVISLPFNLRALRTVKLNNHIRNLYWCIMPPSFQGDWEWGRQGRDENFPPNEDSVYIGYNTEFTGITFTYNSLWESWYNLVYPDQLSDYKRFYVAGGYLREMFALKNVVLPSNITGKIATQAFANDTALEEIYIPDGTWDIYERSFQWCDSLVNVSIPADVDLGNSDFNYGDRRPVFVGCTALTEITYRGTVAQWNSLQTKQYLSDKNITVHCTDGDVEFTA